MATLQNDIKEVKELSRKLMDLNQVGFQRDELKIPIGINWTLDEHLKMFSLITQLQNQIRTIENKTKQLF